MSDENDRYSKVPHASYEFKIPIDIFGRSDNYGFIVYLYDDDEKTVSTWPSGIEIDDEKSIPSPSVWGDMISPDKKLPEFGVPALILILVILPIILLTRTQRFSFIR